MHYSIRRLRKPGEVVNYQQARTIGGRQFVVSSVDSPSAVTSAKTRGFTHVLVGPKWKAIDAFKVRPHGGHNAGAAKRERPRHEVVPATKSKATEKGSLRKKPASNEIEGSIAFLVDLPKDGERRAATKAELRDVFSSIVVPRGILSSDYMQRSCSVTGNSNHSKLVLNSTGRKKLGVESVVVVSKVLQDAKAVFGCSLSHMRIFQQIRSNPAYAGEWAFVFEDDAYLRFPASDVRAPMSSLLQKAGRHYDVLWLGATSPEFSLGEHVCYHLGGADFLVRSVKATYGAFAYAIRKACLQEVLQYWDLRDVVHSSDGALRKSLRKLRGGCCVPQLVAHRSPGETGGSRIHSRNGMQR